ncbi:uncharacterized protein LOC126903327 isoform X2 [Daktulosphaira vitifoliae]|uniref:uncharacterized protein LOC126903327 isoform X2 n=1 Tax=Daktulosphaira vitifoliae TaxID=58002 RepID=UPI0021A99358|nr:uncharacterized protein LOC126903327 isoform X2 [Daktulosphaira vitifoliae]
MFQQFRVNQAILKCFANAQSQQLNNDQVFQIFAQYIEYISSILSYYVFQNQQNTSYFNQSENLHEILMSFDNHKISEVSKITNQTLITTTPEINSSKENYVPSLKNMQKNKLLLPRTPIIKPLKPLKSKLRYAVKRNFLHLWGLYC